MVWEIVEGLWRWLWEMCCCPRSETRRTISAPAVVMRRLPRQDSSSFDGREHAVDWPKFDAQLLQSVAAAFLRRRQAIAYHTGLSCEREFSESSTEIIERLNLNVGHLRLCVWADGVMWLGVCVRGFGRDAGWAFKDTFHGDVQDVSAESLVGMVEATLALSFGSDPESERQQLRALWARVHPYVG